MTIATPSQSTLTTIADAAYPSTGTIGYIILLKAALATGLGVTANSSTGVFTTASAHGLVTGSRVRIASTGTVPSPLSATTDYYAIVSSTTTLRLAATLADTQSSTAIALTDAGSGSLTLNERPLTAADSIAVLVNKELASGGGYSRLPIANAGAATIVSGNGEKSITATFTNSGSTSIDYIAALVAFGIGSAVGSVAGATSYSLATETVAQSTAPGQTRAITVAMRIKTA
jgi:hypothetical protein